MNLTAICRALALGLALIASPAVAQWQVPLNAVPIGRGAGATGFLNVPMGAGTILLGHAGIPTAVVPSGAFTFNSTGVATLASVGAATIMGNPTAGSTTPAGFTIQGLTARGAPDAANDKMLLFDNAAGTFKYVTPAQVATAATAGVSTIAGNAGAFTLANGIDNSVNQIQLTAARRTLPTIQTFTSGSGTYTTPANTLWIEILLVGGGSGGGSGNGSASSAGGNTCWNTSGAACTTPVYQGSGAAAAGAASTSIVGAVGGGVAGSSTCTVLAVAGGDGDSPTIAISGTSAAKGGKGGDSSISGSGSGGLNSAAGVAAKTNSGSGGGGGGNSSAATAAGGAGGGGGGTCRTIINTPAASYTYAVGAAGAGSTGPGLGGANGGNGAAGLIVVVEHYGT